MSSPKFYADPNFSNAGGARGHRDQGASSPPRGSAAVADGAFATEDRDSDSCEASCMVLAGLVSALPSSCSFSDWPRFGRPPIFPDKNHFFLWTDFSDPLPTEFGRNKILIF